ncbi:GspH/FimT family pseudopilin [Thermodesulfobacteriota bacterium]
MIGNGAMTSTKTLNRERGPTAKEPKGFSLVELLVVIVIMGVIAAIGTPQLLGMRTRSSVRADARDLHSAYRQAQTEAVKRSVDACVEITPGNPTTYQIQVADYFGTIVVGKSTALPQKELRPGNITDITDLGTAAVTGITGCDPCPCFNRRGLTVSGVSTIEISNPSLTMEVTLSPSGHVKSTTQ